MTTIATLIVGFALGWLGARIARRPRSPVAPPATARQLARAARANRADLRLVERTAMPFKPGGVPDANKAFTEEKTR